MSLFPRASKEPAIVYFNPSGELNAGLWILFVGATFFLGLRLWCKLTRRYGLWYDDYILIASWSLLLANDILISYQFATGYVLKTSRDKWDDRMHILINISSCLTPIGQAWSKTAFGVTLLRLSNTWQKWVIWFCIVTLNVYMLLKVLFQWAKVCNEASYQNWYRLDFCIDSTFRDDFKEGGNVYNIIMDFVFAGLPWFMTRNLSMRRLERIGLCITMSLGMLVAIITAIRISWVDDGNSRDVYYIWRKAMSQIWYSSEVAGTIMVQCIPVMRPILRELHASFVSKHLSSTTDDRSTGWRSQATQKRISTGLDRKDPYIDVEMTGNVVSKEILPEPSNSSRLRLTLLSPTNSRLRLTLLSPRMILPSYLQERPDSSQQVGNSSESVKSLDMGKDEVSFLDVDSDAEEYRGGLAPPPRRVEKN